MKIVYGDIFSSNAKVLVCPVNRMGVMGAGLAKQFKERVIGLDYHYRESCKSGLIFYNQLYMYYAASVCIPNTMPPEYRSAQILCFPTKHHWRDPSDLTLIKTGLLQTVDILSSYRTIVAWPALGCGLGKLDWESQVRPLMESILDKAPFESTVYLHKE